MKSFPHSVDVLVVGAGFGGIYAVDRFARQGMTVLCLDQNDGPGGVWNQSHYPGARVDSSSHYYALTHDPEVYREWLPTEEFSDSREMRRYFNWLVDRLGIEPSLRFNTMVTRANYEGEQGWTVETSAGDRIGARYLMLAIGGLNAPNIIHLPGEEDFRGRVIHTSAWPTDEDVPVDGRVGVIGTGSSGVQVVTQLAGTAERLHVFQRTPQYSLPLGNHPLNPAERAKIVGDFEGTRRQMFAGPKGRPVAAVQHRLAALPDDQRRRLLDEGWSRGGNVLLGMFSDLFTDPEANAILSDFVRDKIKSLVRDPETAARLTPSYGIGGKRVIRDAGFYEAFNQPHVHLVSLTEDPILHLTETGVQTATQLIELDVVVMATGFDAMTGPLFRIDVRGEDGIALRDAWRDGQRIDSMGGLMVTGFPNLFVIGGAQTPSVHVNSPLLNEYMIDQAVGIIDLAAVEGAREVHPPRELCERWTELVDEAGRASMINTVSSWYNGGNIDGKPSAFLTYLGGFQRYQDYFENLEKRRLLVTQPMAQRIGAR